jgi:YggT family protein
MSLSTEEDMMLPLLGFIAGVIWLYIYVVIASAIVSWLIAFNVVNTHNRFVYQVADMLYRLTEPALRPIRRFIPNLGGIDISPVILILFLMFITNVILPNIAVYFLEPPQPEM